MCSEEGRGRNRENRSSEKRFPMAAMEVDTKQVVISGESSDLCSSGVKIRGGDGLRQYYLQHIHDLQLQVRQKKHNLNRLEAQRNDLNSRGV